MASIAKVTTNDSLVTDLRASLRARCGVAAGMTWASFKTAMAQLGVEDDDFLGSIEYGVMQGGSGYVVRDDEDGLIEIREVSHARR